MPVIRQVLFPPDVEEKLWLVHGLTQWEVEQVVFDPDGEPRWDVDEAHGGRVIIRGHTHGADPRLVFVSLRPVDLDTGIWACVTAFAPAREDYGEEGE